jgi:hypothetical protein
VNLFLIFLSLLLFNQESSWAHCFHLINAKELFLTSHQREIDIATQLAINNHKPRIKYSARNYPKYSLVKKRERPLGAIIKLIVRSSPIGSFYTATAILIEKILIKKPRRIKIFNLH